MQYPLYSTIKAGVEYSKQWPVEAELNGLFVENKVISFTFIASRFLPICSLVVAATQLYFLGAEFLPQIITTTLFLLSLPLQAWYWLGVRAVTPLPPSLATWYLQIREKMLQCDVVVLPQKQPGRYKDLAVVLRQAYQQLDKTFLKQWL